MSSHYINLEYIKRLQANIKGFLNRKSLKCTTDSGVPCDVDIILQQLPIDINNLVQNYINTVDDYRKDPQLEEVQYCERSYNVDFFIHSFRRSTPTGTIDQLSIIYSENNTGRGFQNLAGQNFNIHLEINELNISINNEYSVRIN